MRDLAGFGQLIRLILRRDRTRIPVWIAVLAGFPILTADALVELYASEASRRQLAATFNANPAYAALLGPIYDTSLGALTMWRIGVIGAVIAGLMASFMMIRHTREEEEAGRRELLGATVVGRHTPLMAALALVLAVGALVGAFIYLGLTGLGLPASGSTAFGLGMFLVIAVFAGVGGLCAQLLTGAGSARGLAVAVLGVLFMLRATADGGGPEFLGWLSPLGWFTRLRPFAGEEWWVTVLSLGLVPLLVAVAVLISSRRDVGSGVFTTKLGPSRGDLSTALGLAWRLQRPALIGWTIGVGFLGALYGTVANSVDDLVAGNPVIEAAIERMGGLDRLTDTFFSFALGIVALVVAAYAIRTTLRLRTEEEEGRAEPLLATPTERRKWMWSHLLIALVGPAVLLMVAGAVMGATYGAAVDDLGGQVTRVLPLALAYLPAVWVFTGLVALLFGVWPRGISVAWSVLGVALVIGQLGQILQFPQWLINLSPFSHVSAPDPSEIGALPMILLLGLSLLLVFSGLGGFSRRDLKT